MLEKFLDWIKIKFGIDSKISRPTFKEREIWWCNLDQNIGDEENGKGEFFMRPVIIVKKFNNHLALVVPTSKQIKNHPFYVKITYKNHHYSALISHIHTIYVKRLRNKITKFDDVDFFNVINSIQQMLTKNWSPISRGVVANANLCFK